jgi:hypothetical protein
VDVADIADAHLVFEMTRGEKRTPSKQPRGSSVARGGRAQSSQNKSQPKRSPDKGKGGSAAKSQPNLRSKS